jgi:serine phosphatase RsbU (regulator of sigma subunit)
VSGGPRDADRDDDLFEDAPCGYVTIALDGRIIRANRAFAEQLRWEHTALGEGRPFGEVLTTGARLYYETHVVPYLMINGVMGEVALELRRADRSTLPALVNANLRLDDTGRPTSIRMIVFEAGRRRRYEQGLLQAQRDEHGIARELQHSLLAGELPSGPEFELAIAYRAAERTLSVGGDWYDAFWLDDRRTRIGVVVGDVVGHGLHAATTMGQLRSATRALATVGQPPGALLGSLDAYSRRHAVGIMTTVTYAEVDLAAGAVHFACAGHPPPLRITPEAEPELLWDGRSEPLAAFSDPTAHRPQATVSALGDSTLLLYSDGLTERHADRTIDGLEILLQDATRLAGTDPQSVVDALSDLQRSESTDDDLCLLAVRLV